jgi:hypothetical protein
MHYHRRKASNLRFCTLNIFWRDEGFKTKWDSTESIYIYYKVVIASSIINSKKREQHKS